jgi:hypothetical protein
MSVFATAGFTPLLGSDVETKRFSLEEKGQVYVHTGEGD